MSAELVGLAERRERLVAQAAAQRMALAQDFDPWRRRLARADQALAVLCVIRSHPEWIVGGVVLFVALRPNHVWIWLRRGWVTWQIVQKLRGT